MYSSISETHVVLVLFYGAVMESSINPWKFSNVNRGHKGTRFYIFFSYDKLGVNIILSFSFLN